MRAPANSPLKKLKAKTVVIENTKGGVGKTTLTVLISRYLATKGKKVLLVDLDGQANASRAFGMLMENTPISVSSSRLFDGSSLDLCEIIAHDIIPNIDLIPSHMQLFVDQLTATTNTYENISGFEMGRILRKRFEDSVEDLEDYDYIFFDCNPYMGEINFNIFALSDSIICPIDGTDALIGVLTTIRMWDVAKKLILSRVSDEDYAAEKECIESDDYYLIYNKYQDTVFGKHIYDVLRGKNLTERESILFSDYHEAFVECPIPMRTIIQKDTLLDGDENNTLPKSVIDDRTKESLPVRKAIEELVENLTKKGAL